MLSPSTRFNNGDGEMHQIKCIACPHARHRLQAERPRHVQGGPSSRGDHPRRGQPTTTPRGLDDDARKGCTGPAEQGLVLVSEIIPRGARQPSVENEGGRFTWPVR